MSIDAGFGTGPLEGLVVVELGQYIAGPYASRLLADLGATVVKVESSDGDPMRRWEGSGTMSPQFAAYNRSKRAVMLDLKSAQGAHDLAALVHDADVVIDNFRPGVMERLGFGPSQIATLNPSAITCSITGFGSTGPYVRRPSYDTVVSAIGGMYSQVVPAETVRPLGPAFSDLLSGQAAAQAILAALHSRAKRGTGEHIEISMVGALMDFLTESTSTYLETGAVSEPDSRPRRAQAYALVGADDKAFVVHMSVPEKFWIGLLAVLERIDLAADERFRTREARVRNYDALDVELKAIARMRPRQEWLDRLVEHDIPHGPLNTVAELFEDPQIAAMELVETIQQADGSSLRVPRHTARFSVSGRRAVSAAPALGEGNQELLQTGAQA